MNTDIKQNFASIFKTIAEAGFKRTSIAKGMGYTSTAQLTSTLVGEALISTKAVIELIKNFNVNPTYLFTGQGPMFLAEKDEISKLKEKITKLEHDNNELTRNALELAEEVKTLGKRNGDLIDFTALALKNYKEEEEKKE